MTNSTIPFVTVNNLRLEVETAPAGLPNLVLNPSGAQGAWFWVTPTANTVMTSSGTDLTFKTTTSQACNFTTDFMPVAVGKYLTLRLDISAITASHNVKVTYDFYNSAKALLSSSTQGGALSTIGTNYGPTVQTPASTAYVKARLNFYNGTGNASANAAVTFNKAMVTWSDTGTVTTSRTNLIPNPSFETNTNGWQTALQHTATTTTAQAAVGTSSLAITKNGTGFLTVAFTDVLPVAGGRSYSLRLSSRAATTARSMQVRAAWYDAGGANFGSVTVALGSDSASGWTSFAATFTAPSNATGVRLYPEWLSPAVGETHYLDAVLLEEGSIAGTYFDGAKTDTGAYDYAWTGPAHASTSTETSLGSTSFAFSEPYAWRNILGPTHTISIDRAALDVGTMSADVLDAALDPAASTDLQPGKRVRLQAFAYGDWWTVFEGRLNNAQVSYERDDTAPGLVLKTRISLTARDNIAVLANQSESRGLASVASLPFILEGKGVPWNVNGSGNQVSSATQVSSNENASLLDQIALIRDSVSGLAWVDRNNVLQAWDKASALPAPTTFNATVEGWTSDANATASWISTVGHTSFGALKGIATAAGATSVKGTAVSLSAYADDLYEVSLWIRTESGTYDASIGMISASGYGEGPTVPVSSTEWTRLTFLSGPGPGVTASFTPFARIWGAPAGLVYYVDDVQIRRVRWVFSDQSGPAVNSSFSAIDAGFNTDAVINEVSVNWLRYDATVGTTEEISYGPYSDSESKEKYGPHAATYTLHGATESATAIEAFANSVLAANATPVRRTNSLTFPVKDDSSMYAAALVDLYSAAKVALTDLIDDVYRVTSIKHTISTERWTVDLGFEAQTSVAAPAAQNSPNSPTPPGVIVGRWINPTVSEAVATISANTTVRLYDTTDSAVPAEARTAHISLPFRGRATANTAGVASLYAAVNGASGTLIAQARIHNESDPTEPLNAPLSGVLDVRGATSLQIWMDVSNDPGSGAVIKTFLTSANVTYLPQ